MQTRIPVWPVLPNKVPPERAAGMEIRCDGAGKAGEGAGDAALILHVKVHAHYETWWIIGSNVNLTGFFLACLRKIASWAHILNFVKFMTFVPLGLMAGVWHCFVELTSVDIDVDFLRCVTCPLMGSYSTTPRKAARQMRDDYICVTISCKRTKLIDSTEDEEKLFLSRCL